MNRRNFFAKAAAFVAGVAFALSTEGRCINLDGKDSPSIRQGFKQLNALPITRCWELKPGMIVRWMNDPQRLYWIMLEPQFDFVYQGEWITNWKCNKYFARCFRPQSGTIRKSDLDDILICFPDKFTSEEIEVYG